MKLNLFYYGEDNSHCSACWEPSDENLWVLLTTLSKEKMKELIIESAYGCWRTDFHYGEFLKEVFDDHEDCSVFFELDGRDYLDEISGGLLNEMIEIDRKMPLKSIIGEKDCKELEEIWQKRKEEEKKRERKKKEEEEKIKSEQIKKEIEKGERKLYNELKKKYGD